MTYFKHIATWFHVNKKYIEVDGVDDDLTKSLEMHLMEQDLMPNMTKFSVLALVKIGRCVY
jgi:hypothetical protein